jgi:hypothetical protein
VLKEGVLARFEEVIDHSRIADHIEARLPVGVRPRQLSVRTLVLGILLALFDGRPAQLTRVHAALVALPDDERLRLGVLVQWKHSSHHLTYRQVERTFSLVVAVLDQEESNGLPSEILSRVVDDLIEASIPEEYKDVGSTRALAVDWTDVESFAQPPFSKGSSTADPDASWGHRRGNGPGQRHELFFGYYLQLATMVNEEAGPPVPELVRRTLLTSCHVDQPPAFVGVLAHLAESGVALGDVLADAGYSHRVAEHWSLPLRSLGAELITDLHPHDRGRGGTYGGAICFNGNLYCPSTPEALFTLEPLSRGASEEETDRRDKRSVELSRYKLGTISADDQDGYRRVGCPAALGKVRCPRRGASMTLSHSHPEILEPPAHPPTCCTQKTLTVPPHVMAKTRQKHDYPSKAHRESYGRRSAAERSNSTVKDPASNDVARGWCRVMGLEAMTLMLTCVFVVRNQRIISAFGARQGEAERRLALGLAPKQRSRRRQTTSDLIAASANPSP